jgi:hypothetical protein
MPCLLVILVLAFPRIVLACLFFLTNYLDRAYHGQLIMPVLGFFFLPLTTLAYAYVAHSGQPIGAGANLIIMIIAVVVDLGGLSGGEYHRRRR